MKIKIILLNSVVLVVFSCQQSPETSLSTTTKPEQKTKNQPTTELNQYTYKTTFSPDVGWGYQIFNNDAIYINQPHIPAIPGKEGFSDEEKAIKTAEFIIKKLENNIFPPTISVKELDSLKVLK